MNDLKGIIEDCNKSDLVSDKVIKKVIEIIGQEEWQILHDENNDVCTTMGELIITLEGIAELEKENAELKEEMNAKQVVLNDFKSRVETVTDRFNKKSSQLIKAKEIIKKLLSRLNRLTYTGLNCEECKEAEQFLKGCK